MELKLILQMIRRWAWLLTIGLLVGGGIGYVLNLYQTPEYTARAKILVMEPVRNSSASSSSTLKANKEMADTYLELLFTQPIPVSYTHLDVYKRQVILFRKMFINDLRCPTVMRQ